MLTDRRPHMHYSSSELFWYVARSQSESESADAGQVPLNPAFNSQQVISALSHLDASHLIIGAETNVAYKPPRENVTLLRTLFPDIESGRAIESEAVPSLKQIILVDNSASRIDVSKLKSTFAFSNAWNSGRLPITITPSAELNAYDTIKSVAPLTSHFRKSSLTTPSIQFTSGTTAMPKAAMLSHRAILNNGFSIGERMELTPKDIVVCPPPLFHCFGCILGYMATATHGSSIVFPSEAFNPTASLLAVQEERATALYGVATMFAAELELIASGAVRDEGWENLRTGIAAGSSVPSVLMEKLHRKLNLTGLTICYGMTETAPVSFMTGLNDPLEKRVDSVGLLMPHVDAKIVSETDHHTILPLGEKGELVVSGYNVMAGYWGDKLRTDEVRKIEIDQEGNEEVWMYTGDEAQMDAHGYVKITGRIKDLIIRGGENIHPLEVENALFAHDFVSEASVVGLPDEKYGECVAAFIVVHGDVAHDEMSEASNVGAAKAKEKNVSKQDLRDWVRSRLSPHLVPKYVFWTSAFPKTPSGKIQKFKLREQGIALVGAGKGV